MACGSRSGQARGRHGTSVTTRLFVSGATRDTDTDKLDFDGFLAPRVLRAYAEYMHGCRVQADGAARASDNWQKGIPRDVYMKSMWRHFFAVWDGHRAGAVPRDALCALLFNVMGYLFEETRQSPQVTKEAP